MALFLNGKQLLNSLVIDGEAFYKATILEGSASTDKWAEPLIYNSVNVLDYEVLCFKGTDQGTAFNLYYKIADLPISADPVSDNDYTQFSTNGYLYVDANGYLYFCVTSTRTLVLNEIVAYSGKENSSGGDGVYLPQVLYAQSINRSVNNQLSYTFTENKKVQYLAFFTSNNTPSSSMVTVSLNAVPLSPTFDVVNGCGFLWGEVSVSSNDTLYAISNAYENNRGLQFIIFENAIIEDFAIVGVETNNGNTFSLSKLAKPYFQSYKSGYYGSKNNFHWEMGMYGEQSLPTPGSVEEYFYGKTYVITV